MYVTSKIVHVIRAIRKKSVPVLLLNVKLFYLFKINLLRLLRLISIIIKNMFMFLKSKTIN